jgi:formamidopyrimidine-DNA glycosylase
VLAQPPLRFCQCHRRRGVHPISDLFNMAIMLVLLTVLYEVGIPGANFGRRRPRPKLPRRECSAMPELPEVESITRRLRPAGGHTIDGVAILQRDLAGQVGATSAHRAIVRVRRHGKSILVELDPPMWLAIRLGMTGQCLVVPRGESRPPHTHVVFTVSGQPWELLYRDPRRFGRWGAALSLKALDLGPDALALRRDTWERIVDSRRGMLRPLLMNQQIIAGLGNIYTNEALFAARLHPRQETSALDDGQRETLYRAIKSRCEPVSGGEGRPSATTAPDGSRGRFRALPRVRPSGAVRRCGAHIEKLPTPDAQPGFCPAASGWSSRASH